jgi:hypothetical protein
MSWEVEYTDTFERWFADLTVAEQEGVDARVALLERYGPGLSYPFSSGLHGSAYRHMRELRIQHEGRPYRVLYAFDPRWVAILLIGGEKTGQDRWYEQFIPLADRLYREHLAELNREDRTNC